MPGPWVIVVPVKDAAAGKTRLSGALDDDFRVALVRAMALDTIAAAVMCAGVGGVVVVTADEVVAREAAVGAWARGASDSSAAVPETPAADSPAREVPADGVSVEVCVVAEPPHGGARSGLDAAAAAGVAAARKDHPAASVAVLLGDLPALRRDDLAAALRLATSHERAMVPDAAGTGTTLLAVGPDVPFRSAFGVGSAAAHAGLGYVPLEIAPASTLRQDVDLPADLVVLRRSGPGPRTAALLG